MWAEEQWSAWIQATHQDAQHANELMPQPDADGIEGLLVPVRYRNPVPWFKKTDRWL
jgi:hypothetical protein